MNQKSKQNTGELYCDTRLGGVKRWYIGKPENANMRVPDEIRDCTFFLCVRERHEGVERFRFGGTGFFISMPSEADASLIYIYLVTAKHNVERSREFGDLYIRLNMLDGGAMFVKVEGEWVFSEDETIDAAVIQAVPPRDVFDYKVIPLDTFATERAIKENGIGIGDDIVIVGLFSQRHGNQRNLPIVRSGIIASMPDEPLLDKNTGLTYEAYLVECRSIGGLSGSPVFATLNFGRVYGEQVQNVGRKGYLLGLVRGHYRDWTTTMDISSDDLREVNLGIAIVTPIEGVRQIILGEELTKVRRENDKNILAEKAKHQTLDSGFQKSESDAMPSITHEGFEDALKRASQKLPSPPESEKK